MTAPFRFPRAAAFTTAMIALAAGAHIIAGGSLPQPAVLAGITALVLAPVMILAKFKLTTPVTAVLLVASQLVLHQAFNALSLSTGPGSAPAGHLHGSGLAHLPVESLAPEHAATPGTLMLILHAAATVATAVVLARGEAAVWALAAWLRPLVRILTAVLIPDWPLLPAPAAVVVPSRWRNLRLPARRGPPVVRAAH
ncbi:hypothetical protein [Arthrobacter sp. C152]